MILSKLKRRPRADPRVPAVPPGFRVYAIGDVHGRLDLLDAMLARIEADVSAREPARNHLVLLGDLIDRGPDSRGVIERLRALTAAPAFGLVLVIGNHEEVLLRLLAGEADLLDEWLTYGGAETVQSYGVDPRDLSRVGAREGVELLRSAIPDEHRRFLESGVDTLKIGDYLFVHAGIRPGVDLSLQMQRDLRWIRQPFLDHGGDHGFVVVHGHTISEQIEERSNRVGIDTGAYATGRLSAIAIEGDQRWFLEATH